MVQKQDDGDSEGELEAGRAARSGPSAPEAARRGSQERRWWHVPDEQIERLVHDARRSSGISLGNNSGADGNFAGTLEPPVLRSTVTIRQRPTLQSVQQRRTVRFEDEQSDALDQMLQAAEQQRQQLEQAGGATLPDGDETDESGEADEGDVDWSTYPPEQRPKDWWRVPDERINKLVRKLSKSPVPKLGSSATLSATALAALGSQASPARVRPLTGTAASAAKAGNVTLHILVVETGETLSLRVPRCLRAGPGRPPPSNPLTDIFGQGASSRGFEATAFYHDCRFRFSGAPRKAQWTAMKASSLKGLIAMATEVEPARQRLCYRGGAVSLDDMSVASYRFRDGELMELHFLPPPNALPPAKREVVLACTRKRHELKEKPKSISRAPVSAAAGEYGVLRRPDGDVQILPRWNHRGDNNIFSKVGIAIDGDGSHKVKPAFAREPIYLSDANDPRLSRVREAVAGHSRYL